ncbi:MAG: hypothetical protein WD969_01085 [Paracoccaceae bacterium]
MGKLALIVVAVLVMGFAARAVISPDDIGPRRLAPGASGLPQVGAAQNDRAGAYELTRRFFRMIASGADCIGPGGTARAQGLERRCPASAPAESNLALDVMRFIDDKARMARRYLE